MTRQFRQAKPDTVYYQSRTDDMLVVVFDGQHYRNQTDGPNGPPLEEFDENDFIEISRLRYHGAEFGNYPWDHWEQWALEDGVSDHLAALGRELIREADQHGWPKEVQDECGWNDSGAAMIQFALNSPDEADQRWDYLMECDGEDVEPRAGDRKKKHDTNGTGFEP